MLPSKVLGDSICILAPASDLVNFPSLLLSCNFMELILVSLPYILLGKLLLGSWFSTASGKVEH